MIDKDKVIQLAKEAGWTDIQLSMAAPAEIERLSRFYTIAFKAGMERAAEIAADVDEPGWTGYECPNTFDDGRRAAVEAIRAHAQNHPKPTHDSSVV